MPLNKVLGPDIPENPLFVLFFLGVFLEVFGKLPDLKSKIFGGNLQEKTILLKKVLGPDIPENNFFQFVVWCGLDFKSQRKLWF